jgi:hypothetical protein
MLYFTLRGHRSQQSTLLAQVHGLIALARDYTKDGVLASSSSHGAHYVIYLRLGFM